MADGPPLLELQRALVAAAWNWQAEVAVGERVLSVLVALLGGAIVVGDLTTHAVYLVKVHVVMNLSDLEHGCVEELPRGGPPLLRDENAFPQELL